MSPRGDASLCASQLLEKTASTKSSSIFIYDLAEHFGFGSLSKQLHSTETGVAITHELQTRSGAGLNLVGRLLEEGTSKDVQKNTVLSVYTTPNGLALMVPSFTSLPKASVSSRAIIQIPTVSLVGQSLELSPTLSPVNSILSSLPDSVAILLSSTPQEIVDFGSLAYRIADFHVIHFFDHYSAGRELGHELAPTSVSEEYIPLKDALGTIGYSPFEYEGATDASTVVVMLNNPLAPSAKLLAKNKPEFGVLIVKLLRPWDEESLLAALPVSVKSLYVLDDVPTDGTQGILYSDVFSACMSSGRKGLVVRASRIAPSRTHEFVNSPYVFASFLDSLGPATALPAQSDVTKKVIFFGSPNSPASELPDHILDVFSRQRSVRVRSLTNFDVLSKPSGISTTRVTFSPRAPQGNYIPILSELPLGSDSDRDPKSDFIVILDQTLLKTHTILDYIKSNSSILLFSTWTNLEVLSNLPGTVLTLANKKNIKLYNLNTKSLESSHISPDLFNMIGGLVFLRLYLGQTANESILRKLAYDIYGSSYDKLRIDKVNAKAWSALEGVDLASFEGEAGKQEHEILKRIEFNAIRSCFKENGPSLPGAHISSWHDAARHILFPDVFGFSENSESKEEHPQNPALRPEIPERTYLVTCSVNRRLTPTDYDRNVFHLEFDTAGTGLKYAIGEALGVHGWNDTDEVLGFCSWYGVDPDRLITIPVPGGEGKVHTRTIFQALQQQIDLFGRPPKSFYGDLSQYATSKNDKLTLQFIASPEGSSMFKKLSEKDTLTFADVLKLYPSARPSIEVLCELIGDIKPRHYSIASAQSVVGDRVDLLVVTVEWQTPSGSPRYGQCTRYLAGLKVGQKVTVSIKPSVMKLPPSDMQPLILAGLGTGAAPFRAFLQHRALLMSQGKPVGPLYYYFGSRYRSKEYLYGEEIEAFILDKTITRAGLAFSRDSRKKVYIQHKMVEDGKELARMLYKEEGVFYLCGPTWPVPDVYEALVSGLVEHFGFNEKDAGDYLEGLKEEERYVLEVY